MQLTLQDVVTALLPLRQQEVSPVCSGYLQAATAPTVRLTLLCIAGFFFTDFVYMYALITELYCQVCRLQLCKLLLLYTVTYLWDLRTNIKICVCHVHYRQTTRTQHVLTMCGVGEQVIRR